MLLIAEFSGSWVSCSGGCFSWSDCVGLEGDGALFASWACSDSGWGREELWPLWDVSLGVSVVPSWVGWDWNYEPELEGMEMLVEWI